MMTDDAARADERIRWRLQSALTHLDAAAKDPGRMGLAYWQLFHALDELDAQELGIAPAAGPVFLEAAEREKMRAAVARTASRLRSIGVEP